MAAARYPKGNKNSTLVWLYRPMSTIPAATPARPASRSLSFWASCGSSFFMAAQSTAAINSPAPNKKNWNRMSGS